MSGFGLEDAKQLVRAICGECRPRTVVAGVVMIAPIFCKSFKVEDVIQATGFRRNQVERVALNLWRYGIWTNDEAWACEWGELFAGEPEKIDEDRMFQLQICFILDTLVAEGLVRRAGKTRKDFMYQTLEPPNNKTSQSQQV